MHKRAWEVCGASQSGHRATKEGQAGSVAHMAATQGGPDEERLCLEEKISGGGEYCNLRNKRTETKS